MADSAATDSGAVAFNPDKGWIPAIEHFAQCFLDGTVLDAMPTGYYFPGLGGPYFSISQTGGVPGDLVGVISDGDTCRMPFDFSNLIIDNTDDFRPDARIRLFPNPASGRVTLDVPMDLGNVSLQIFSTDGRLAGQYPAQIRDREVSVAALPPGVYTALVSNAGGLLGRRRVVVR